MLLFAYFTLVIVYDMIALVKVRCEDCRKMNIMADFRTNCGWPHISQYDCEARGCCFDNRDHGDWCFYPPNMIGGSLNYDCIGTKQVTRKSCGYPEISETECNKRGCCFHVSVHNYPSCYYNYKFDMDVYRASIKPSSICRDKVPPAKRVKCGCDIISQSECEYQKCCFDDSIPNAYFCYYPSTMTMGGLSYSCKHMNPTIRVSCGYQGISEVECNKRNCCFDDSITNAFWCFFPKSQLDDQLDSNNIVNNSMYRKKESQIAEKKNEN